jgi:hypothetical protein
MEIKVMGDQLILSGPVVAGDYEAVESSLSFKSQNLTFRPQMKMIILKLARRGCAHRLPFRRAFSSEIVRDGGLRFLLLVVLKTISGATSPTTIRPSILRLVYTGIMTAKAIQTPPR